MTNEFEHTIEAAEKRAKDMDLDPSVIPWGMYCCRIVSHELQEDGTPLLKTQLCPYWALNPDHDEQNNGYCSFLKEGDWQSDGLSLLWDQCKECGVNPDEDDDEDEEIRSVPLTEIRSLLEAEQAADRQ